MECLNCKKELEQIPQKRPKKFCNSTCRSNYWQKEKRKEVKPKQETKSEEKKKPEEISKGGYSNFWKQRMADKLGIK